MEDRLARPHKYLDGAKMERWFNLHYFEVLDEWECEGIYEYQDFWDFVCEKYPDEMDAFESWFRRNCL